jgi:hypothetical protein
MRGHGRASLRRRLFTLFVVFAGLYLVFAILPRWRRKNGHRPAARRADAQAPPEPVGTPAPEPETELEPVAFSGPPGFPTFPDFPDLPERPEPVLPPVAALAGGTHSPRRGYSRARVAVLTFIAAVFAGLFVVGAAATNYSCLSSGCSVTLVDASAPAIIEGFNPGDATGSGVFDSFVRVQKNGIEKGYNTDGTLEFNTKSGAFTHSILLSAIPTVPRGSTLYRELVVDINQDQNDPHIALDDLELYVTDNASITGYPFPGTAVKEFDLDGATDNAVELNSEIGDGSGKGDYRLLVPDSVFDSLTYPNCVYGQSGCTTYLVLYTKFGEELSGAFPANGGFEEWGVAEYTGSKSGVKFNDANANGVQDPGELGLEGWKIFVDLNNNGSPDFGEPFDLTDSSGAYLIQPIPPGTWNVREDLANPPVPGTWQCTAPSPDCFYAEEWDVDTEFEGNDFGNFQKITPTISTDIHTAAHTIVTSVALGTTVHDQATVTGAPGLDPTGSVTFTFYTTASDCTGASVGAGTVALVSGVAHPSTSQGPLAAGSYSFQASYPGDSHYNAATSACEPLTVTKATPTNVTEIHDATEAVVTGVALGTTVHDQATVTGIPAFDPTGSVTFTFYTTASDCTGASVGAGTVALVSGVAHPSTSQGPLAAGSYSFRASYPGDTNYNAVTSDCEPLTVNKADTTTATEIHDGTHTVVTSVPAGTTVHDQATVSESNPSFSPTGSVTFTFYTAASDCTGASVAAGTVPLVAGVAHPSDPQGPLAAGSYSFRATYAGDSNFNGSTSACEPLEVTPVNEGCTPGFWQGGVGAELWDENNDPDWVAAGGGGFNPFIHDTVFNDFFTPPAPGSLGTLEMFELVGTGGGSSPARRAMRQLVAAYLNASFGMSYPYTTTQLESMWATAVASDNAALGALATQLGTANELGCPIT